MKFEKRIFMGIELDVLVGHPEHELLFIATQVGRASGLKDPSYASCVYAKQAKSRHAIQAGALIGSWEIPKTLQFRLQKTSWMFSETATYQMLLAGKAPQSEPFRKWVTEEVLPSIRKTGSYNAADSQNPIAVAIMDELKSLRGEIVSLRQELQAKTFSLEAPATEASPYEGQPGVALCDPAGFNVRTYRELAGEALLRPAVDRLEPRVVLHLEVELGNKWDA